jgi:peptidoglycan/xylan/chitin deacetylase (PgdA/CDA1 family)
MSMPKFRFDRAISVRLVHPVSRVLNGHRAVRVPILMYHGIRSEVGDRHPYFETNTRPELFAQHMKYLRENGYATVDLNEAMEAIMTGRNGQKRVVITFDDGFRDFYTHAFPILAESGLRATVFVVSGWTNDKRISIEGKDYLTWKEVREMYSYGIRIGSHTVTHPELYKLAPRDVEFQVRQSKETIEDALGEPIRSFSYPYAFPEHDSKFVERLKELLQTHGYENGVSTILGTASTDHDWFFLPRLPVNSFDDLRFFRAKLEGGYDWLHAAQKAYKKIIKRMVEPSANPELAPGS